MTTVNPKLQQSRIEAAGEMNATKAAPQMYVLHYLVPSRAARFGFILASSLQSAEKLAKDFIDARPGYRYLSLEEAFIARE